ncbi:hypothetical protein B0H21DRAFT_724161 [Amylocystis lapponica]|nr:hypothetical protein B0H21DRAFT_724161 [Amylocystis lapponica]
MFPNTPLFTRAFRIPSCGMFCPRRDQQRVYAPCITTNLFASHTLFAPLVCPRCRCGALAVTISLVVSVTGILYRQHGCLKFVVTVAFQCRPFCSCRRLAVVLACCLLMLPSSNRIRSALSRSIVSVGFIAKLYFIAMAARTSGIGQRLTFGF